MKSDGPALEAGAPQASDPRFGGMDEEDRRLMARIAIQRDAQAFEQLYARFRPRLAAFLTRLTRSSATVEEVYNDVMWLVWNKAGSYHGGSRVSTWIFAIGYRRCLKTLSREQRHQGEDLEPLADADEAGAFKALEAAADDQMEQDEQRNQISAALRQLSAEQRMVVELSYFSDYNYDEIAKIAGCPVNTVKTRMFHARRRLRQILPGRDGSLS